MELHIYENINLDGTMNFPVYAWAFLAFFIFIQTHCTYLKQAKPIDYLEVFNTDRSRCPRYEYSFNQLTSNTCPECRWVLPNMDKMGKVGFQSLDVWQWLKKYNCEIS